MEKKYESDARNNAPSFDEMVTMLKKLFTDYLEDVMKTPPSEIRKAWDRYKTLNHLYPNEPMQNTAETYPGKEYQELFDYFSQEHGLTLLESEMSDIIHLVHKLCPQKPAGAVWVAGEYNRLYEQLKADPKKRIVCYVDHNWLGELKREIPFRDICTVRGETMEFVSRGHGYGGAESWLSEQEQLKSFLEDCERLHVQWLDETTKK